jgi:SAM-dependent methyltransferase
MTRALKGFARRWILPFGDPRQLASLAFLPKFFLEMKRYRSLAVGESVAWHDAYPCLSDRITRTPFDPHYFYQGAWLARRLSHVKPTLHVDVGSSVSMISVLSAGVPMVFLDYRPLAVKLSGLQSVAGDAAILPFPDDSILSLSSLHVIEHVGLGRYGDPLDPEGTRRAAIELQRVLRPGGRLFLSVPVGRERVCFNAHRVFSPKTVVSYVPALRLESFALVDDGGQFLEQAPSVSASSLDYGCGMFEFVKPHASRA